MSTELQTTELSVPDALSPWAILAQVKLIHSVMTEVMIKDTHYGVIPGTGTKPTLLKAGAEKLLLTFRLDPQYESTEHFLGEHLFVRSKCTLYHQTSGRRMGSGEGSCSTKESKYAYRQGKRFCPNCGLDAIIKGKEEYGGGWLCFKKKGGCGWKWPDGAPEIEGQSVDRIANEDLADQYNTILKMANKRSLIAAVLNVTAASDIFTQDVEDLPPPPENTVKDKTPLPTGAEMLAKKEATGSVLEPPVKNGRDIPLTNNDLANAYDQFHGGRRARTLPIDTVIEWAATQTHLFRVDAEGNFFICPPQSGKGSVLEPSTAEVLEEMRRTGQVQAHGAVLEPSEATLAEYLDKFDLVESVKAWSELKNASLAQPWLEEESKILNDRSAIALKRLKDGAKPKK